MLDIEKWRKTSPVSHWASFITLIVSSLYGIFTAAFQIKDRFTEPPAPIVEIRSANFQGKLYDEIYADFVNPANFSRSFRSLGLVCTTQKNQEILLNSINNFPPEFNMISGLQNTPINIDAGKSASVSLFFVKNPMFKINAECKNIAVTWIGLGGNLQKGKFIEVPPNAVTFSNLAYTR